MFGLRQHLQKCITNAIVINGEEIPKSDCIKYLGGWVNTLLSFKTHIIKKCQAAMGNLVKIHNIRKYLMEEATKTPWVVLALSHLDSECSPSRTSRLQHQQNAKDRKHGSQACNKSQKT